MKIINKTSQEQIKVLSFPADESLQKKSRRQENTLNKNYPDYDSLNPTTENNNMVCDLGI